MAIDHRKETFSVGYSTLYEVQSSNWPHFETVSATNLFATDGSEKRKNNT